MPPIRFPVAEPELGAEETRYVDECLRSGWISSIGPFVERFERALADYCGSAHGIAVANGTVALHLALTALGIGKGDEVIVPDLTFVATANAVAYTGARVVLADAEAATWNLDPAAVERAITTRTRAIVPVHLYGHPCDMDAINAIARRHRLHVVEDAAEALGAEYQGRKTGTLSRIGTFSFYANKTITTGEGGLCVTDDARLAARMRFLKDHAMSKTRRYYHPEIGFNYRLTALQAAVGLAQAERLPSLIERKRAIAGWYRAELDSMPGLTLAPELPGMRSSFWMYSILVGRAFGMSRDALAEALRAQGIDTRPFFWPLHRLPPYRSTSSFPVATRLAREGLNLPSSTRLTAADIKSIADVIRSLGARRGRRTRDKIQHGGTESRSKAS
jgi:perosamine synthetase